MKKLSTIQSIVDENFINFSLIVHEKSLNIPDDKEEDFDNNINFLYFISFLTGI
jgi:hypothetical protein